MTTSKQKFIDLINDNNPEAKRLFTSDNIRFSTPVATQGANWNTKITVVGINGKGYRGNQVVYYTRVPLTELGPELVLDSYEPFTPETLIESLNALKGTPFTLDDFEAVAIPPMGYAEDQVITLVANPSSFAWIGQVNAVLSVAVPEDVIDSLHVLLHQTMPGPGPYF